MLASVGAVAPPAVMFSHTVPTVLTAKPRLRRRTVNAYLMSCINVSMREASRAS